MLETASVGPDRNPQVDFDSFCDALITTVHGHVPKPREMPFPLCMADVKHWVRRRWPLPPEAMYAMNVWARDFLEQEGWVCRPHGTELAAILGLRDPSITLAQRVPRFLRTRYEDGFVREIVAIGKDHDESAFPSEEGLLAWLAAPADVDDLWSLFLLERIEADEASQGWLDDRRDETRRVLLR